MERPRCCRTSTEHVHAQSIDSRRLGEDKKRTHMPSNCYWRMNIESQLFQYDFYAYASSCVENIAQAANKNTFKSAFYYLHLGAENHRQVVNALRCEPTLCCCGLNGNNTISLILGTSLGPIWQDYSAQSRQPSWLTGFGGPVPTVTLRVRLQLDRCQISSPTAREEWRLSGGPRSKRNLRSKRPDEEAIRRKKTAGWW